MRKLLIAIGAVALTAAVIAGIVQTRGSDRASARSRR